MADPSALTVVAGIDADPLIFEVYEDDPPTQRTDFTGWTARFVAYHDSDGDHTVMLDTDSTGGLLSIEPSTDGPDGDWIVLRLPGTVTANFIRSGEYTLVLIDNGNPLHVVPLVGPSGFSVRQLEFSP